MAFLKFPDGPTVLKEYVCPDYEPTEKEIQDYAVWLGMDPEEDRDLFWIARAGVKSPMPEPWKPCLWEDSEMFFFNFETGQSVWDHPCDEYYRRMYLEKKAERVARLVASGSMSADQKDQKDKKAKKKKKEKKEKNKDQAPPPANSLGSVASLPPELQLDVSAQDQMLGTEDGGAQPNEAQRESQQRHASSPALKECTTHRVLAADVPLRLEMS
mmetsp:Transcript_73566/g.186501  ORF Transcript_73566/g.186501 Transcript_73566/m.186501 type:complete len:214 (+) Transcript_73566:74-715(+)|eukprot:CAMPEP_0183403432 /NCGR_PEP_ID=MMETSP0370-20130417/14574_1 /TAXON_ID=268820 /ORGANISM="Peridinium aciculiferum, Strain PAER-2" /LENGTH=213 /DNA_ID=CAMNT_0025585183 /DNA_START=80 /DNA_END=721 /DNA_ORIENTATION=+